MRRPSSRSAITSTPASSAPPAASRKNSRRGGHVGDSGTSAESITSNVLLEVPAPIRSPSYRFASDVTRVSWYRTSRCFRAYSRFTFGIFPAGDAAPTPDAPPPPPLSSCRSWPCSWLICDRSRCTSGFCSVEPWSRAASCTCRLVICARVEAIAPSPICVCVSICTTPEPICVFSRSCSAAASASFSRCSCCSKNFRWISSCAVAIDSCRLWSAAMYAFAIRAAITASRSRTTIVITSPE